MSTSIPRHTPRMDRRRRQDHAYRHSRPDDGKNLRSVGRCPRLKLWAVNWANDETVLFEESVTRTINIDKKSSRRVAALGWPSTHRAGRRSHDAHERRQAEWVTGANCAPRALVDARQDLHVELGLVSQTMYQGGNRHVACRATQGLGLDSQRLRSRPADGNGKVDRSAALRSPRDWLVDDCGRAARAQRLRTHEKRTVRASSCKDGLAGAACTRRPNCGELDLHSFSEGRIRRVAVGRACGDRIAIKVWSIPLDGTPMKVVFEDPRFDVEGVHTRPVRRHSCSASRSAGPNKPRAGSTPQPRGASRRLHKSFGARWITLGQPLGGQTADVVAQVEDDAHPPIYYLVDYSAQERRTSSAKPIHCWLGVKLGSVRDFDYEARDKYALTGYLTLPPGAAEKNLPLVVMPHGGPEARDTPASTGWPQFLASRGYRRVAAAIPRLDGLGRAHADAGRRQWGLRMQDDVTDGVQALIDAGHRRSEARLHRRLELRRIRRAGGRRVHPGALRLRREHRRRRRSCPRCSATKSRQRP